MTLDVLGNITAEQFLTDYWQKKPLLVRNALPEVIDMFTPDDIKELALEEHVTARLITQHGKNHDQWQLKCSPLCEQDFHQLPPLWTLLVQAVDHYSFELADLWKKFSFIPQWRRDDIMISYAPKGGSVGQHFDYYDVFLVQAHGQRRWQLGQMCDEYTALIPNQPLKLLTDMQVQFDEVLNPGDLLYVPPGLSHYGVAENDCLTLSFGFRMPNVANMIDRTSDYFADHARFKSPLADISRQATQTAGEVQASELAYLKHQLLQHIQQSEYVEQSIMALMSEAKYPDNIPEPLDIDLDDLSDELAMGAMICVEPASRLIYRQMGTQLEFWSNGEPFPVQDSLVIPLFKRLADGESLTITDIDDLNPQQMMVLLDAINQSILLLNTPEEVE